SDQVETTGFTLTGTASDNVAVSRVEASLSNSINGLVKDFHELSIMPGSNEWAFTVTRDLLIPGSIINITVKAYDSTGHWSSQTVWLSVANVEDQYAHVLNRTSFGLTPQSMEHIKLIGVDAYLAEQLNPNSIDDTVFQNSIAGMNPTTFKEFRVYSLKHMLYSKRQLLEAMTWFWDNHFNTHYYKHGNVNYELQENNLFRENALGNFRDLLGISAKSPAMLYFLDSVKNFKSEPNENYARELLELHTLGVENVMHTDIEALAKVFTGWQVKNDKFYFNSARHNVKDKFALGQVIPGGGVEEGEMVLDILASHPSTANFICSELIQYFVNDVPPVNLVNQCASVFLSSNGNIKQVLSTIFSSTEFNDSVNYGVKVKTPLEYITHFIRNTGGEFVDYLTLYSLSKMGFNLFANPVPTGWAETGDKWLSTNFLVQQINFVNEMLGNTVDTNFSHVNLTDLFLNNNRHTANDVAGFINEIFFDGYMTQAELSIVLDHLNTPNTFDINGPDAETRLKKLVGFITAFPDYQMQ
ncbi:MAG: DUF1800 domain-containing protein, partial [Gammaproteobacteria bacterium]|nr:DUF1800 domain-containing protein [Gammaproteobacteria bacterium]